MNKKLLLSIILALCFFSTGNFALSLVRDEVVDETLKHNVFEKPFVNYMYNYEDTKLRKIRLCISYDINSEKDVYEGQIINFKSLDDVYFQRKKILEKGEIVPARVETVITSGMNGIPSSIIFGNFKFKNIPKYKIDDTYEVFGQDRSLWVFPLKWALTPLPPTGSFTNFIKGGHAKLKSGERIELNYYPQRKVIEQPACQP